ncbi:MAG: CPBP family intramembrane metalloprotease [Candidatus Diapherotrites archaeon]|nr:CPBP family intramembrane metalloprotease [Candidatus Diapherotrites archaeon]
MLWYQKGSFGLVFFTALIVIGLSLLNDVIANVFSAVIMLGAFVFFTKKYSKNYTLNFEPKLPDKNGVAISLAASAALAVAFIGIGMFFNRPVHELDLMVLAGTLLFVTAQEFFWRGTLQKLFCCKMNPKAAITITTALFALSQTATTLFNGIMIGNVLFAATEGLVLGAIVYKTNKTELAVLSRILVVLAIYLLI